MTSEHIDPIPLEASRRTFLGRTAAGLGVAALNSLLYPQLDAATSDGDPADQQWTGVITPRHFTPKAKRVIFLYQAGGPSHLETFDPKPELARRHGEPMPESFTHGQQIAQLQGRKLECFGPQIAFRRFGQSGLEMCELFPRIGSLADELCIVRSMYTEQINHDPAHTLMNTGAIQAGYPSMGSWLLYGLGADTNSLPGYIVLVSSGEGGQMQPIAARQWSAGFLPSRFQGVNLNPFGDPVLHIRTPKGLGRDGQRQSIDAVNALNRLRHQSVSDPEIMTRIAQYEMAFRMQASVPDLVDMNGEPKHVFDLYGCTPGDGSFAANCLLARKLAERGVRFIQLYHRDWDHHQAVRSNVEIKSGEVDQATAALMTDLRERGMLDDTLVVWGGEFGRTPMNQDGDGRDHHIKGFSMLLAGGGIRGGMSYGNTDELGYAAVENPVSVHDLHATMLHLLGIDHSRLSVRFQGLDARLTGVEGARVVHEILA